jgi:glycosyltransferase involved in cell wall biosynthesis
LTATGYDQTVPEPVTVHPLTVQPSNVQPSTLQPSGVQPSTLQPSTVAVVVPVRDEERLLRASLAALRFASHQVLVAGVAVRIAIVLDCCRDRSREIATNFASGCRSGRGEAVVQVLETESGNVGLARSHGFRHLLDQLDDVALASVWLATTDADTQVPPSWLVHQLARRAEGVDAWAGTVVVADWSARTGALRDAYQAGYATGVHVHGANMGVRADAYLRAGGFPPYATAEDQALWHALSTAGATMSYDPGCPVITSARRKARAPRGFAQFLNDLESGLSARR